MQDLSVMMSTGKLEDKDSLINLIDQQLEADQRLMDCSASISDDRFMDGLKAMSRDDYETLKHIREKIVSDEIPSREMIRNYIAIRGQNYTWVIEEMLGDSIENLGNIVFE